MNQLTMATTLVLLGSPTAPVANSRLRNHTKYCFRRLVEHVSVNPPKPLKTTQRFNNNNNIISIRKRPFGYSQSQVAAAAAAAAAAVDSILSLKETTLSPFGVCKWCGALCILIAATKWSVSTLANPFFWMYFSWTWLFWPWFLALALALYGLYCVRKHSKGEANIVHQLGIVTSAFTWLTLVPPAHFNGYLQGWPFVFFLVYHYFFFFNVSVRKRLYGHYFAPHHDPKWDVRLPYTHRLFFCAAVMLGHWLAAFEAPELHLIPGGWTNFAIWAFIMLTLFMHYHSTLYLAKYSDKVVVPTSVVQFGPYRWVRHPIYSSVIILFAIYCAALRAPLSLLFLVAVCVFYYDQKVKLEEHAMIQAFGERYTEYMSKVRYKFIPFVI